MQDSVNTLQQDFKQKEMKLLNDFSRLKTLKNKLENKLYAQDQSIQTVHMMLKPKTVGDEHSEKDIVDPNPFHLKKAKTVQPTIYDGDEILKPHHIPVTIYDSEETLEIAETTRQKMSEKMNDPECVAKRVKIIPPNYSKENFLATFTPQTQLTPEQVFWSLDLEKRKAEELKANTPPLRKLAAAMVYPPNTPAHLVPRTLPTKCKSVISIFVLNQLFADFDKMCTKRITPTGITEDERGFEQTKRCYLTEVIPFFKLLKEHFEGVQKTLVTKVKEMKEIFESIEAEVDQNAIDLRSGEIERKNLLITNENLIVKCIAQDVFYTVTDSALTASQFHELSIAYNVAKTRAVELEAENLNLHKKFKMMIMITWTSKDAPEFDAFFELNEKDAQLQTHRNTIRKLKAQISHLKANKSGVTGTLLPQPLDSQNFQLQDTINKLQKENNCFRAKNSKIKQHYKELYDSIKITRTKHLEQTTALLTENESLKESVEILREIIEEAKVERPLDSSLASVCRYTKHSQEFLEYVIGTCPKDLNTRDNKHSSTPLPKKKQVTFEEQCAMSKRVNSCTDASRSQPRSNTKKNRILPAKSVNMKKVEEHPRTIKSSLKTTNRVDSSISSKHTIINSNSHSVCQTCNKCLISANHDMCVVTYLHSVNASPFVKNVVRKVTQVWKPKQVKQVVHIVLWYLDSGCSKHMTVGSLEAQNFMKTVQVRIRHDHSELSWVMETTSISAFRKHSCYVRDTKCVELIKGSRGSNLYTISIEDMMKSSPICLLSKASKNKSWLWHRRLNHLNFGTINDLARKDLVRGLPRLKFEKDHLYSACQLGKSKKHTHKPKTENTNLEVLNTLHMDLCGPMRVQTINGKKYILVIVDDYSRFTWVKFLRSKDETPEDATVRTLVERRNRTLVEATRTMQIFSKARCFYGQKLVFGALCYPTNDSEDLGKLQPTADIGIFVAGTPSSTTIDQDAHSPSHSLSSSALQSPSLHQGVAAESTLMEDNPFSLVVNNPFINVFALEPSSEASSFGDLSLAESPYVSQTLHHLGK
ncbi:retrovirus-related pol polyprotein from transposon TNT 1-94 [Tanacetum coccineum]|uniref:Retrovirus-related pol polyprotein from transposon TNT 1-94 n=1 Tax=Tanacetum coccineum TaxID=301880 RepID=A0ABQ5FK71_9ASTR